MFGVVVTVPPAGVVPLHQAEDARYPFSFGELLRLHLLGLDLLPRTTALVAVHPLLLVVRQVRVLFQSPQVCLFRMLQVLTQHFGVKPHHDRTQLQSVLLAAVVQKGRLVAGAQHVRTRWRADSLLLGVPGVLLGPVGELAEVGGLEGRGMGGEVRREEVLAAVLHLDQT